MSPDKLAILLQRYDLEKRQLSPARYAALEKVRQQFPELFDMGPGPAEMADQGILGTPAFAPEPQFPPFERIGKAADLLTALLSGETVDNQALQTYFGFSAEELEQALKARDPLVQKIPDKAVLLTFDDSTIDHYRVVAPALEKYDAKATFFTTEVPRRMNGASGFSDKSAFMTWEQIKELSDMGHEIANHSLNHRNDFCRLSETQCLEEIHGIEERCDHWNIPKPITFGYPMGGCTRKIEALLHNEGYCWGRGDLLDAEPKRKGDALYDPRLDTPLVMPTVMPCSIDQLHRLLDSCKGDKAIMMVYHDVTDDPMSPVKFETMLSAIYDYGGTCITCRQLSSYVDPEKAYQYTHEAG